MVHFTKRIILFILILGFVLLLSYKGNQFLFKRYGYRLSPKVETVITGSSLVANGINPQYIENSCNVGLAAEPVMVSYLKIRDILSMPNNVDQIILSFSLIETSSYWDEIFSKSKANGVEMFSRISFLRKEIDIELFDEIPIDYFTYTEVYLRNRVFPVIPYLINVFKKEDKMYPHIGGFSSEEFNIREVAERGDNRQAILDKMFYHDSFPDNISSINFSFLDSIVVLTDKKDINLILVGMPMDKSLYEMIPFENRDYYQRELDLISQQQHVYFVNLTTYFHSLQFFNDYVHINIAGADSVAKILDEFIRQKEIKKENKRNFFSVHK